MGQAIVLKGLGPQEAHLAIALGHQMPHLCGRDWDGLPRGRALLPDNGVGIGQTLPPELAQTSMQSLREQSTAYERYYRQLQSFVAQRKQAQRPQRPSPIYVVSPLCHLSAYEEMYERYFRRNAFLAGHKHIHLEPIYTEPFAGYLSRTYNSFLERYDYSRPAWFVFVHGDYEITCDLNALLAQETKDQLLGPVRCRLKGDQRATTLGLCLLLRQPAPRWRLLPRQPVQLTSDG